MTISDTLFDAHSDITGIYSYESGRYTPALREKLSRVLAAMKELERELDGRLDGSAFADKENKEKGRHGRIRSGLDNQFE